MHDYHMWCRRSHRQTKLRIGNGQSLRACSQALTTSRPQVLIGRFFLIAVSRDNASYIRVRACIFLARSIAWHNNSYFPAQWHQWIFFRARYENSRHPGSLNKEQVTLDGVYYVIYRTIAHGWRGVITVRSCWQFPGPPFSRVVTPVRDANNVAISTHNSFNDKLVVRGRHWKD
jgi:hypothetical protein